ncbi:hypothetical protein QJS10_CPB12g01802 [Acorus calamus]|uniref:DUF1677 family protein n=1 Tax=Acorus calamus TaxID=4465 RepID=A0AAV9DLF5_ACOCL|nr:hypothetical protein QJS10_CPB12g01802 [Acorus calamus]
MSATVLSDPSGSAEAANETVRCECCGFAEECTQGYIDRVREKYLGRWICGLCAEAVKDEILRSSVSMEEAMDRHVAFCGKFRSAGRRLLPRRRTSWPPSGSCCSVGGGWTRRGRCGRCRTVRGTAAAEDGGWRSRGPGAVRLISDL